MIKENLSLMIVLSSLSLVGIAFGLFGVINRNKIDSSSKYYISLNILISAILSTFLTIFYIYNVVYWTGVMSKDFFYFLLMIGFIIILFIGGMHGILNEKKINDVTYSSYSELGVLFSILFTIGLIAYWIKWHH